jgi:dipeptidyl aminopeptidase/acylaminoacyl peptidase
MVDACFIQHPEEPRRWVELRYSKPDTQPPWPTIVLLHGHQSPCTPGARAFVEAGRFAPWTRRGMLTVAVSQPGYGGSDGPPDYCGPRSQAAVRAALRWSIESGADPGRLAIYGFSRGAITGAMAATAPPYPAANILQAGVYDLVKDVEWLRSASLQADRGDLAGILKNIEREAGLGDAALVARSVLYHADKIRSATLLLHGEADSQSPPEGAIELASAIAGGGVKSRCITVPGSGHSIPYDRTFPYALAFLEEVGVVTPQWTLR